MVLVEGTSGYTEEIMLDEFNTMVLAGMETSANTLCLLFLELDRRPDLWKRYAIPGFVARSACTCIIIIVLIFTLLLNPGWLHWLVLCCGG